MNASSNEGNEQAAASDDEDGQANDDSLNPVRSRLPGVPSAQVHEAYFGCP